jgi:hypothetical protein
MTLSKSYLYSLSKFAAAACTINPSPSTTKFLHFMMRSLLVTKCNIFIRPHSVRSLHASFFPFQFNKNIFESLMKCIVMEKNPFLHMHKRAGRSDLNYMHQRMYTLELWIETLSPTSSPEKCRPTCAKQ